MRKIIGLFLFTLVIAAPVQSLAESERTAEYTCTGTCAIRYGGFRPDVVSVTVTDYFTVVAPATSAGINTAAYVRLAPICNRYCLGSRDAVSCQITGADCYRSK